MRVARWVRAGSWGLGTTGYIGSPTTRPGYFVSLFPAPSIFSSINIRNPLCSLLVPDGHLPLFSRPRLGTAVPCPPALTRPVRVAGNAVPTHGPWPWCRLQPARPSRALRAARGPSMLSTRLPSPVTDRAGGTLLASRSMETDTAERLRMCGGTLSPDGNACGEKPKLSMAAGATGAAMSR